MTQRIPAMPRKKTGGQTKYTDALARTICLRLAEGITLNEVCRADDIPVSPPTVLSWVVDNSGGEIAAQYMRARATGYQIMADEIIEIIDDGRNDYTLRRNRRV